MIVRNPLKSWLSKFIVGVVLVAVVIGGGVFLARNYYNTNLQPVSADQKAVIITIPKGSSVNQIADSLKQYGLIRSSRVFEQYVRGQNIQSKLQAGTYSLQPSLGVPEIADILVRGNVITNLFTIVPGKRLDQIKSAMINAGFKAADVDQAFEPTQYSGYPALSDKPASSNLEGYLFPDSYQRLATTTPQTIIGQSLDQMQKNLTRDIVNGFVAQGLTVNQGVTLASVVEQEVAKPADRAQVAQVFISRLQKNMPLQSDVITRYGDILANHAFSTTYDTPYNVYLHAGFPPTPIGTVSQSSLQAVAHPASTDWLYFVSGDNGNTYFSHTLEEHEQLTSQYCHKLCS